MALDPMYGTRVRGYAQQTFPEAFAPAPTLAIPQSAQPEAAAVPVPTAASTQSNSGFPELVLSTQGTGPKLSPEQLEGLKQRYLTETVRPRESSKKGVTKLQMDAVESAFGSKADRWIADYLKKQEEAASAGVEGKDTERGYAQGGIQGTWDTLVSAVKGATTDTASGLLSLQDYTARAEAAALAAAITGIRTGSLDQAREAFTRARQADLPISAASIGDSISRWGENVAEELTSDETLQARAELGRLMEEGASVGDIASFIGRNPSAASGALGETIGFVAPAIATGGASAYVRGSAIVGRLSQGTRIERLAAKALENAVPVTAAGVAPTGDALGDLRRSIQDTEIEALIDTPDNKAIYDSLQELGLSGERLNRAFRQALFNEAEDITLAGAAAANLILPGVAGAPAERALAGLATRQAGQSALGNILRTGAAEAGQEALAAVPETVAGNIAESRVTDTPVPLTQGLAANAALGAGLGAVVGGGASAVGGNNPFRRRAASVTEAPAAETVPPTEAPAAAVETPPVEETAQPAGLMAAPGPGLEEAQLSGAVTRAAEAAALAVARPTGKKAIAALDAGGVLTQAQNIAQRASGNNWATMTAEQRLATVEGAAEVLNKQAKKDGVATALAAMRSSLAPAGTPAGSIPAEAAPAAAEPVPEAPETPSVAAPEPEPTPVAAETPPAAAPSPAPAVTTPETTEEPALPRELAGAKPRWGNGPMMYAPQFESDIDKALYIVGQTNKSAKDAQYRKWLKSSGIPENRIDALATQVRSAVRSAMEQERGGSPINPARVVMPATNLWRAPSEAAPIEKRGRGRPRKNPLARETPSPKAEAPAQEPGQPLPQAAAPTPQAEVPAGWGQVEERDTASQAVRNVMPDIEEAQLLELTSAVELAREGDTEPLRVMLKELQNDGEITRTQAAALRKVGESLTPAQQGLTERPVRQVARLSEESPVVRRAVDAALKGDKKAGALLTAVALDPQSTEAQVWLAERLAPVVDALKIKVSESKLQVHGVYDANKNTVSFSTANPEIVLHELIHGVTSRALLAKAPTVPIRQFQKDMDTLAKHVRTELKKPEYKALLDAYEQSNRDFGTRLRSKTGYLGNSREFLAYGLTNETFREVLSQIPAPRQYGVINAWQAFKELVRNALVSYMGGLTPEARSTLDVLIERSGAAIDYIQQNPDVVDAAVSNAVAGKLSEFGTESLPYDYMMQDPIEIGNEVEAKKAQKINRKVDTTTVTHAQRLGETLLQASYGLERSEHAVRKAGGNVTPENSPYFGARKYTSDIAENRNTDNMEVVQPLENWIATNWRKFRSASLEEFRTDLDKFLQNYHALNERNPSVWAENVPLRDGMELERAALIDDAYEGKLTGPELQAQLRVMAEEYGVVDLETWAKDNPSRDPARAQKVLEDVAKRGFTPEALGEFNALMQNVRNRTRERMEAAGIIAPEDPFADRGWQWYVPLKGVRSAEENAADMDYGARPGTTREFRSRNLKVLQGRSTNADNALEQMIVDMNQAATAQAEGNFKSTLFQYVLDNEALLGATVRRWEGTPKSGYTTQQTITKDGKLVEKPRTSKELPNPNYGFVYNDGLNHWEVRLPKGSQLDRGLKRMREIAGPDSFEESNKPYAAGMRGLGNATNFLARAYTTWSPTWQLTTAFLRDVNALPLTVAVEAFDTPWKARVFAGQYTKNLIANTLALGGAKAELKALLGNREGLRNYATENPDSYVAKLLAYREAGGSTEFSQGLNRERAGDMLFNKARRLDGDLLSLGTVKEGYDKWNELTGNWAALLENKGRVAAWEALMATGMTSQEAAARVKGAMDYGQSGEWGRLINTAFAFYRVGATSVDTMRRAFTTKEGDIDFKKAANWLPVASAMGAIYYTLATIMLGDDEDGVPLMKKISADTLTQRMILPDGQGDVLGPPIGLGLPQLMFVPGILGAAVANGHITPGEATNAYYETVTRNTPIQPSGRRKGSGATGFVNSWLQALLPTVTRPIGESVANTNAFDAPIRTDYPKPDRFASDQGMPNTPKFWKDIAQATRDATNLDMYPETIRHFVKAWGGQPANNVIRWTLDFNNKEEQGLDSRAVRTALRLGVSDQDFYYTNEARKAIEELNVSRQLMRSAVADADDDVSEEAWKAQNPNDAKRIAAWGELDKARDAYFKRKAQVRDDKLMSAQGKRDQLKLADAKLRTAVDKARAVLEATD